jgi:hypothetical protein
MAEEEGFEPSVFFYLSVGYKVIVSKSCLAALENTGALWQYPNETVLFGLPFCRSFNDAQAHKPS